MPDPAVPPHDLPRNFLTVVFLCLLLGSVFWILRPFLAALIWAATIVTATWPLRVAVTRWLGGRAKLTVALFTLGLVAAFLVPTFLAIGALVSNVDEIAAAVKSFAAGGIPAAPGWIERLPLVGTTVAEAWNALAASPLADLYDRITPYLGDVATWFAGQVGGLGKLLMQFLLTAVVSAVLWSTGEAWAAGVLRFARALGGEKGAEVVRLAGQSVRAVALGVVVTAIVQAVLGGIGLAIVGIPMASVLTVVMFLLSIAQLGPLIILLPAAGWLFFHDQTGWGIFLLVWSLVVGTLDNFLRPALIRRGADLPLLLVFAGVLGGLISLGLVGLFIGPVVLAVARTLLQAWLPAEPAAVTPAAT
ncbi:MAG: AI-2E family transporter YdiK [Thermoanaerobaculia bacterium]